MKSLRFPTIFIYLVLITSGCSKKSDPSPPSVPNSFEGSSANLEATTVVPTLNSAIPAGQNAVWCASFQSAWKLLQEAGGGPVIVEDTPLEADLLNRSDDLRSKIPEGCLYLASWDRGPGAMETIQRDLAKKFPEAMIPALETPVEMANGFFPTPS